MLRFEKYSNDPNILDRYKLQNGQRDTIYDFSRLVRREGERPPTRKIRVYYMSAEYDSSDTGDVTLANSYDNFNYAEIPSYKGNRIVDFVDGRPRVSKYSGVALR